MKAADIHELNRRGGIHIDPFTFMNMMNNGTFDDAGSTTDGQWMNEQPPSKTSRILSLMPAPYITDMQIDSSGVWRAEQ